MRPPQQGMAMVPQPAQRPFMHMPPTPGHSVPVAAQVPAPPPVQQPLFTQVRPAQQAWLSPPQPTQVPIPPPAQVAPEVHAIVEEYLRGA